MFKFLCAVLAAFVMFIIGCTNNPEPAGDIIVIPPVLEDTQNSNEPFYPFIDYINNQLAYIDSTPFGIEKILTINGKTIDSTYISKSELKKLAQQFILINPDDPSLKPYYLESSFNDLTLNRLTFSITAQNAALPLQQADILLNPENQMVKNVVLRKQVNYGDSSSMQHLVWVDKMHFQISETITKKDNNTFNRVTRVVWDKPLE
jgi:hypothetical protein